MIQKLFPFMFTAPIPPAPRSDWELRQYSDWDLWALIGETPWDR